MKRTKFNGQDDNGQSRRRTKGPARAKEEDKRAAKESARKAQEPGKGKTEPPTLAGQLGMPAIMSGRPRRIETAEEFDELVDEYVSYCMASGAPITLNGMQLWLGYHSHRGFYDAAKSPRPGFSTSVARACKIVEFAYEMRLNGSNPGGAIFALKNFGWMDERGAAGQYARRDAARLSPPPIGQEGGQGPSIDVSALDDDTLEALMTALSQESQVRDAVDRKGGEQVH